MKALGRGSLSSLLKLVVDAALIAAWAFLAVIVLGTVLGLALYLTGSGKIGPQGFVGGLFGMSIEAAIDGDWRALIPAALSGIVLCLGIIAICQHLRHILASLVNGEPFTPENGPRLRGIALAIAVIELARFAISLGVAGLIAAFGQPEDGSLSVSLNISLGAWAAVLVLLVLAQVFQEGARLRSEEKLTI
jgi:hypothetical protein